MATSELRQGRWLFTKYDDGVTNKRNPFQDGVTNKWNLFQHHRANAIVGDEGMPSLSSKAKGKRKLIQESDNEEQTVATDKHPCKPNGGHKQSFALPAANPFLRPLVFKLLSSTLLICCLKTLFP